MATNDRLRTLLSDLGRATMRGVKKCPNCGTYNGSRGVNCKNKFCNAVFKETAERKKSSVDACRLMTESNSNIFSVSMKDKGREHRAFVQLPVESTATDATLCFVEGCELNFTDNIVEYNKQSIRCCIHIQAAFDCNKEAQVLTLKNSVLSSLNVNNDVKQEIWFLATESAGPLVQRISKSIMAVKCKTSQKHPLGYLHFKLLTTKLKGKVHHKFFCSCSIYQTGGRLNNVACNTTPEKRCVHYYACMWAFASDLKLSEEFQSFLNLDYVDSKLQESFDFVTHPNEPDIFVEMNLDAFTNDGHFLILRDDAVVENLQNKRLDNLNFDTSVFTSNEVYKDQDDIEWFDSNYVPELNVSEVHDLSVIDQNTIFKGSTLKIIHDSSMEKIDFNGEIDNTIFLDGNNIKSLNNSQMKILNPMNFNVSNLTLLESNPLEKKNNPTIINIPLDRRKTSIKRKHDKNLSTVKNLNLSRAKKIKDESYQSDNIDESTTSVSFIQWLSSVTEQINQTMHYQFSGKPEPLVFQTPQSFFDCLRERISSGSKKKRLPNFTTAFLRKDSVPVGTFTRYTWHITNILHLKSIFETPLVPLDITRSFSRMPDGTYETLRREETEMEIYRNLGSGGTIKPMELKTFLKVGNTSPDQVQPTPFLIEWIPDILPISKIGELRIQFEFGHITNESSQKSMLMPLSKNGR